MKQELKQQFIDALYEVYPDCHVHGTVTRKQIDDVMQKKGITKYPSWLTYSHARVERGVFSIAAALGTAPRVNPAAVVKPTSTIVHIHSHQSANEDSLIPQLDPNYVPFGNYKDTEAIIKSKMFYPVYITGPSGNGKTAMVEQLCAKHKRPLIRINMTSMADEEMLIGSKTLINGNIEVIDGPVIKAMRMGAILLIDECLSEHEEVRVGTIDNWVPVALSELELDCVYPIVSFNMESGKFENDYGSIISDREDDLYEVELEDGSTITLNAKHPFIVQQNHLYEQKSIEAGLSIDDKIVIME